jgi:hypothetical protein
MSRANTPGGYLFVWDDGDNPGAGSKTLSKTAGGTGLNANFIEIENGLFTEHNANGTHKNDKIDGASLKSTVADGSTLEFSASSGSKALRAKDGGITLVKISSTGAAAGQSPIWNGSAIVWGNPAPTLADASVTRAKIADNAKPVTSNTLFGDVRVAGTASGNAVAAATEWVETTGGGAVKVEGFVARRPEDRYIRLKANVKTNNATRAWKVELLLDDVVVATGTGTGTAYSGTNSECHLEYAFNDGSSITTGEVKKWSVRLSCASPSTASMTNLTVYTAGMDTE